MIDVADGPDVNMRFVAGEFVGGKGASRKGGG